MSPTRLTFRLVHFLSLILILAACTGNAASPVPTQTPAGFTVTDALGRTVTFPHPPGRIALAGRGLTIVTDAVYLFPQASSRLVAVGKITQGQGDFVPLIDPNYDGKIKLEVDVGPEQVAATQPDAVLLKSYMAEKLGQPLESLGIPVVYLDFETPEQYQHDLRMLGQLFQDQDRARQVIAFYQERTERVLKALAGLDEGQKPRLLLLYYTDRDGEVAFNVPPLTWMQTLLVGMAGGRPAWQGAQLGKGWTKVSFEQIAAWDADQIYIVAYFNDVEQVVERLKADPQWQALRAVREGKLYAFPGDFYSWDQPDPRWILGLTWLAAQVHPERFPDLDLGQEIRTFYRELYGLDEAAYQEHILPNLKGDLP
jgi:iron complex transport system substrate-binding protein